MAINNNALASSQATVLSEDGNTLYATIQMRHGKEADMDKSKFVPAEMGVCTDTKKAVVAFAPNETKEIAFKDELSEIVEESLADKLDKNQGAGNAGKMLVVGDNGNVQVGDEPVQVDPTLTKSGRAADALETGHRIDRKAPAIVQDAFGYGGVITDSAEASFQGLKVYGASRQFTTTGANLLGFSEDDITSSSMSIFSSIVNEDGSIHITGTPSINNTVVFSKNIELSPGTYYISGSFIEKMYVQLNVTKSDESIKYIRDRSFVIDGSEKSTRAIIQYTSPTLGKFDETIYPMLNAGSTALPFEPYTGGKPAPNPDYPQEIEVSGSDGEINIAFAGDNLIDKSLLTEGYYVSNKGSLIAHEDWYASDWIEIYPGFTYYINYDLGGSYWVFADEKYTVLSVVNSTETIQKAPENAKYTRLSCRKNNLQKASLSIVKDNFGDTYVPMQNLMISTPNGLPGIPVTSGGNYTDSEGQQWICDEIDLERGKYVQRIEKIIYDGSSDESWGIIGTNSYGINNFRIFINLGNNKLISNRFVYQSTLFNDTTEEGIFGSNLTTIYVRVKQERASDVDSFRSWLSENPVTVLYVLPNPIETDLSAEEIAAYKALRTNYPTTTVMTDTDPQVTLDMQYAVDTKTYIDNKIAEYVQSAISNSLLSTNTAQALSAPMGAELNSKIEALEQKLESEEE